MYIFYHISRIASYNKEYLRKKFVDKIKTHILCSVIFFLAICEIM
jgi:hypothetical protein